MSEQFTGQQPEFVLAAYPLASTYFRESSGILLKSRSRLYLAHTAAAPHQEIGPARTTISAIAERAGVERLDEFSR